jgi:hypothetical protein
VKHTRTRTHAKAERKRQTTNVHPNQSSGVPRRVPRPPPLRPGPGAQSSTAVRRRSLPTNGAAAAAHGQRRRKGEKKGENACWSRKKSLILGSRSNPVATPSFLRRRRVGREWGRGAPNKNNSSKKRTRRRRRLGAAVSAAAERRVRNNGPGRKYEIAPSSKMPSEPAGGNRCCFIIKCFSSLVRRYIFDPVVVAAVPSSLLASWFSICEI